MSGSRSASDDRGAVNIDGDPQHYDLANANAYNTAQPITTDENVHQSSEKLEAQKEDPELLSLFSPHMKNERRLQLIKTILGVELILVAIVLGILSLYWGGLASMLPNQRVLTVAMVDFDGGEIGNTFTQYGNLPAPRTEADLRTTTTETDGGSESTDPGLYHAVGKYVQQRT